MRSIKWLCLTVSFAVVSSTPCFAGIPRDCLQSKVVDEGNNKFLYYADYYESTCGQDAQADAVETGEEEIPEVCPPGTPACKNASAPRGELSIFHGLKAPVSMDAQPSLSKGVTVSWDTFVKFDLTSEGKVYDAKVFEVKLTTGRPIYVAFEVEGIPKTVSAEPLKLEAKDVKKLAGEHAYSVSYHGRQVLFLTARQDITAHVASSQPRK